MLTRSAATLLTRSAATLLLLLLAGAAPFASAQDPPPAPPATPSQQEPAPAPPATPPQQEPPPPPTEPVKVATDSSQRSFLSNLFHQLGSDLKHMPRRNSVYWLAAGSGLALAVHPADDEINAHLVGSDFADAFFKPGKVIGSTPFVLGSAVATYIVGRTKSQPRVRHLGMDLIESTLLAEGITQAIKVAVRRDRPTHPDGTENPGYAFPSGHATLTFAAATVLQQHLGWKAAVPTYLVASYVAISRLHDNRHFASDVAFGAFDGIIIGRAVTWHGRHFYAMPTMVPGGGGLMVSLSR